MGNYKDEINYELKNHLKGQRILCVSETKDNVVMWSHYADNHTGVVLRLQCIDEIDNTLLAAKRIDYKRDLPLIASLDDVVESHVGIQQFDYEKLIIDLPYIKYVDWEYENEWRVAFPDVVTASNLYNDYVENPRVFGAVYFGCRIYPEDQAEILSLLTGSLSHVKAYTATKRKTEFGLDFERIK